ncbi:MAG: hypothetical protein MUF48_19650, partial [Pirellulaceae bacterium]|nr:hypothetical protein [Pirellulaceae bacterium]
MIRCAAWIVPLSLSLASPAWGQDAATLPRGHVFFHADFEGPDALNGWSGPAARLVADGAGQVVLIEQTAGNSKGSAVIQLPLPVEQLRGYVVEFSARVKASGISEKPNPWNGVKFMAPWTRADGGRDWPAVELDAGSFDWRAVAFRVSVPDDARDVQLVLGLEQVSGKAWFDDVRVAVHRSLRRAPRPVATGPAYKGHSLHRLRGAMISPNVTDEDLRVLGQEWNANLIRWQLIRTGRIEDP